MTGVKGFPAPESHTVLRSRGWNMVRISGVVCALLLAGVAAVVDHLTGWHLFPAGFAGHGGMVEPYFESAAAIVEVVGGVDASMLERTWLCEPSLDRVIELRELFGDTPIRLLQTTRLERIKGTPERRAEYLARHRIDGINLHRTDWTGGLVALFHRFDLFTFGWDMQHEHELRDGLRMGLDAVYSDRVDVMSDAFREEIGNPPF